MTVLFKSPPVAQDGDGLVVSAKPFGEVTLPRGDRVFLWWSEAQGGAGLSGHGLCSSAREGPGLLRAEIKVVALRSEGVGFGRDELRPFRDATDDGPQTSLARKLYRHSLNKAVALTRDEEAFLDRLFR
jgi:hypothetical protein